EEGQRPARMNNRCSVSLLMKTPGIAALLASWIWVGSTSAAELKLVPAEIALTGANASQRLLVLAEDKGQVEGDRTGDAKFVSNNLGVATVSETGVVQGVGDGEATITATLDGKMLKAKVQVTRTKEALAPSFRNQVIPLMTKIGCNSGACHGALAGKGGFKLSLRGYAPATYHFVITQQALARRIDKLQPARSLFLLKPTMALSHGGGQKLDVGSTDYQLLADWIASGAPGPRDEDPRIQRLELFPPAALLQPRDSLQVVVR